MNYLFSLLLSVALISSAFGNDHTIVNATTNIHTVTVFLSGAEINESSTLNLPTGRSRIIVPNISSSINIRTIQASLSGNNTRILSIHSEDFIPNLAEDTPETEKLRTKIKTLQNKIQLLGFQQTNFDQERDLILKNKERIGKNGGTDIVELTNASNFFRTRLNEISEKTLQITDQKVALEKEKEQLNKELNDINNKRRIPSKHILIDVESALAHKSTLQLSYMVHSASWYPRYNIRSQSIDSPVTFEYLANVQNHSNTDWKNVNLILSTGNPFQSMTKPTLDTWTLKFQQEYLTKKPTYKSEEFAEGNLDEVRMLKTQSGAIPVAINAPTNIEVSEVSVEFKIPIKYTIPTDGKSHLVEITTEQLPATYKFFSIPKIDNDAFLVAEITNWEKLNIIDSYANIYYNGSYVGETFINTQYTNDTLELSFGRDAKININRVKLEDFNKNNWIGSNKKESFKYEISIRNGYTTPVQIEVLDQVPVSMENEISVTIDDISNAQHTLDSGKLKWNLKIAPNTTQKLTTAFSIKYPKNKKVNTNRNRVLPASANFW